MITPEKLHTRCWVPKRYARVDLQDMDMRPYPLDLVHIINDLYTELRDGGYVRDPVFAVMDGGYGNGKTRVACHLVEAAYAGYARVRGVPGRCPPTFVTSSRLVDSRFDRDSAERAVAESSCFLVIDDVNRIAGYKGEMDYLESVVERRFYDDLSTVLTMNVTLEEVKGRFGSFLKEFQRFRFGDVADMRGR